jgi:hypothetical protein
VENDVDTLTVQGLWVKRRFPSLRFREMYVVKLWQQYLHPCCHNCRAGSGDCDVNPFAKPPTQAECALQLMQLGECP